MSNNVDYIDGAIILGTEYDFADSKAREEIDDLEIATVAETKQYLGIE